ncbi:hypothetical protein [Streptomyces lavendulae]|uniref:hypothetical protein n=1 Tax=Streptomyces lavendulae TaxID=1914 RepID=UPI0031E67E11
MTLRPDSPDRYDRILHAVGSAFDSLHAWPDHPRALATVADAVEQLIEKELTGPQAALAALHEGEEEPTDQYANETPAQWLWQWNHATPERRLDMASRIIDAFATAGRCHLEGHAYRAEDWRADRAALGRVRAELDRWGLQTLLPQTNRALADVQAALEQPKEHCP